MLYLGFVELSASSLHYFSRTSFSDRQRAISSWMSSFSLLSCCYLFISDLRSKYSARACSLPAPWCSQSPSPPPPGLPSFSPHAPPQSSRCPSAGVPYWTPPSNAISPRQRDTRLNDSTSFDLYSELSQVLNLGCQLSSRFHQNLPFPSLFA